MRIRTSKWTDDGGFELDTGSIGLRSMDLRDISLPYTGTLPDRMCPAESAYVYLNVQLVQGIRLVLVVEHEGRKEDRRPLVAANDEIIALLDRFFAQTRRETGMDSYCLGMWRAHYIEWRRIATDPEALLGILSTFSDQTRLYLQRRLTARIEAC